jgi:hypothetical protein
MQGPDPIVTNSTHPDATGDGPPSAAAWEDLLAEFRRLGGVAENIVLGRGSFGRGLFPRNPGKPFLLRLPDNLLFPIEDIKFSDNHIRIREAAGIGAAERDFFGRYQAAFSWGGGGEAESARFIAMLDALPREVRTMLITYLQMGDFLEEDRADRTQKRFLQSRMIYWNKRSVLMPLIELANCGTEGIVYGDGPDGHLQIEGETRGEILVNYGPHDSLDMFRSYGFPSARPRAYSLPIKTKAGSMGVRIGWNTAAKTKRADFWVPEMKIKGDEIVLSHLILGNAIAPRLPRGIFCALMKEAGVARGVDEAFDRILFANRQRYLELIEALEPLRGEMVGMLRATAHFQLEAMTHCIGTRDL